MVVVGHLGWRWWWVEAAQLSETCRVGHGTRVGLTNKGMIDLCKSAGCPAVAALGTSKCLANPKTSFQGPAFQ